MSLYVVPQELFGVDKGSPQLVPPYNSGDKPGLIEWLNEGKKVVTFGKLKLWDWFILDKRVDVDNKFLGKEKGKKKMRMMKMMREWFIEKGLVINNEAGSVHNQGVACHVYAGEDVVLLVVVKEQKTVEQQVNGFHLVAFLNQLWFDLFD